MPLIGRRGPGLVRGVARTAVVAGTATAVSGRVAHRQQERWNAEEQARYDQAQAAAPPVAAAPDPDDPVAQIERLVQLQQQGLLTAEEFSAMKAKILAG
jgi:hypothetical protein